MWPLTPQKWQTGTNFLKLPVEKKCKWIASWCPIVTGFVNLWYCATSFKSVEIDFLKLQEWAVAIDFVVVLILGSWPSDLPFIASDTPLPRYGFAINLQFDEQIPSFCSVAIDSTVFFVTIEPKTKFSFFWNEQSSNQTRHGIRLNKNGFWVRILTFEAQSMSISGTFTIG